MSQPHQIALVPGSFDPLTNGHVDLIRRSATLFDRVVVAVLVNAGKQPLFTLDERVAIAREVFDGFARIDVQSFEGLLVDYARRQGASVVVRGVRSVTDFDSEKQMASMNRHLHPSLETILLMPSEGLSYVSSRLVKEVASLGGSIDGLVPPIVATRLGARQAARRTQKV
jgi:pantetheine-phosphate adenylyltransferase